MLQKLLQAIKDNGFVSDANIASLDKEKDSLEKEINKELYHKQDVYDVVTLNDKKIYFKVDATFKCPRYNREHSEIVYIEYNHFKKSNEFHPVDGNGNTLASYTCKFDNQGSCEITYNTNNYHYDYQNIRFTPDVLFHKGDKKNDINTRLISSLSLSVNKIKKDLQDVLKNTETKFNDYKLKLESHFVTSEETDIAVSGIIEQVKQLKIRIKDCERLEALCK